MNEKMDKWINAICDLRIAWDSGFVKLEKDSKAISTNIQAINENMKKLNLILEKWNVALKPEENQCNRDWKFISTEEYLKQRAKIKVGAKQSRAFLQPQEIV